MGLLNVEASPHEEVLFLLKGKKNKELYALGPSQLYIPVGMALLFLLSTWQYNGLLPGP